ncbi:neutral/alkaline non-lysosomal ceramidase N-terminal domain-containing protein [Paenibacillus eucommiae]|uniref:Neutral/alkaline non-lysosomal ceramidase N-terminal domain-containing protein n=1 Tax=Paenibacillus eucommiae TaxID=1355755 RepID=A0ABS4INI8_9BACL|nr:neutral/alkaline non-lysosomal ceramidase N-terminal domain-containing protein [Paenibacillus eucommiae]MBP1988591.1 hypothetical protein [Paenibacillus eucommiae]
MKVNNALDIGTAKMDITPDEPLHLIMTSDSPRTSKGVKHRLHARVLIIRVEEKDGRQHNSIFISVDIIFFPQSCVDSLRSQIAKRWGIDMEAIVLHATHTHSAPYPVYGFDASAIDSSYDAEFDGYMGFVEKAIIEGIGQAMTDMQPVLAERGSGTCTFASNRRKLVDGQWLMAPDENGPIDPEVTVIRFQKPDGEVKALLVHYTCHPTTTYEDYYSSDYPGAAMDAIEQQHDGDVVSLFMQGCCGDVRPGLIRDGLYCEGSDAEVRKLASELTQEVMAVVRRPMRRLESASFLACHRVIELPYRYMPTLEELKASVNDPGMMGSWSRSLLANPQSMKPLETLEITYIRLFDKLAIVAMNAEMVIEYGHFMKEISAGAIIPLGYSNGNIGYVPTERQLEEGGYEGRSFFFIQGRPSPFDPVIERLVKEAIVDLITG